MAALISGRQSYHKILLLVSIPLLYMKRRNERGMKRRRNGVETALKRRFFLKRRKYII